MSDTEPINYPFEAFDYHPNKPASIAAGAIYTVVSTLLFVRLFPRKTWWGLCLPIGTSCFAAGFFLRYVSAIKTSNLGLFVNSQILIVVSPAAFLAFNYIVYGRFIRAFATGRNRYSLIRPEIVARIFIISDVITFLVQGGGGGLQAQDDTADVGRVILLIGIIDDKFDEYNFPWRLMHVLHFSSVCIIIRATYRVVELAEGNDGYLITHEVFFYVLDTIPLFFATAIYVFYWPGQMIEDFSCREYPSIAMTDVDP